jgi:hypothetical protein
MIEVVNFDVFDFNVRLLPRQHGPPGAGFLHVTPSSVSVLVGPSLPKQRLLFPGRARFPTQLSASLVVCNHSVAAICLALTTKSIRINMSNTGGTYRATPTRGHGRGQVPTFENSPSSIPRPKLETHTSSAMQSDTGSSTLSASRQKQSKRDEVRYLILPPMLPCLSRQWEVRQLTIL